jgi:hypothetical protein
MITSYTYGMKDGYLKTGPLMIYLRNMVPGLITHLLPMPSLELDLLKPGAEV